MTSPPDISANETLDNTLVITLAGRLDAGGTSAIWKKAEMLVKGSHAHALTIDLTAVDYLDTSGAVLVAAMTKTWQRPGRGSISVKGLDSDAEKLVAMAGEVEALPEQRNTETGAPGFIERTGRLTRQQLSTATEFVSFSGDITMALGIALAHPSRVRWKDALVAAEKAGVNALPIVALVSFIVGLVMAFQAAMPMKMFGAEIFVANLIGIAMVRELGPLMTAIILAGRSGSAFAAEIGTMKINEEIDALITMGLNPVMFLMVPRILAAVIITPLLTIFSNFVGIAGGSLVLISMGYPIITYYNQVIGFVTWIDFAGGMIKCFVFGIIIAATGCIRGFQTRSGPSAVGTSTTSAVVTGIVLIALCDGIFSVLYYCLGI